jgi:hypothetical protein
MDDRSWMHRDSPQGLQMMYYCNGVQGLINYALSNLRNISGGGIRCLCNKCKNKTFLDLNVVMMHLLQKKKVHGEISVLVYTQRTMCSSWYHGRKYGWVTSSASNVHGVVDDNSNSYRNIVMDVTWINQGHAD